MIDVMNHQPRHPAHLVMNVPQLPQLLVPPRSVFPGVLIMAIVLIRSPVLMVFVLIHVRYVLLGNTATHSPITNVLNAMPMHIVPANSVTVLPILTIQTITNVNQSTHVMMMVVIHVLHHLQFVKITT